MHRDHMLGWPPALLALDPEPRAPNRTPVRPRVTPQEQDERRKLDVQHRLGDYLVRVAGRQALGYRVDAVSVWVPLSASVDCPGTKVQVFMPTPKPDTRYFVNASGGLYRHCAGTLQYLPANGRRRWTIATRNADFVERFCTPILHPPEGTPE